MGRLGQFFWGGSRAETAGQRQQAAAAGDTSVRTAAAAAAAAQHEALSAQQSACPPHLQRRHGSERIVEEGRQALGVHLLLQRHAAAAGAGTLLKAPLGAEVLQRRVAARGREPHMDGACIGRAEEQMSPGQYCAAWCGVHEGGGELAALHGVRERAACGEFAALSCATKLGTGWLQLAMLWDQHTTQQPASQPATHPPVHLQWGPHAPACACGWIL
jgi:hypothetical protein